MSVHSKKELRIFMARTTGRKRFWFHQNREENQTQTTKNTEKLNEN